MCLSVNYYCICGVVARTENVVCSTSLPSQYEETHQLRQLSMILPREEWNARQGICPQKGCPQNHTSAADVTVTKYKCPGCSTICGGESVLPLSDALEKESEKELEREFSDIDDMDVEFDSDDYFEELKKEIEQGFSSMNVHWKSGDFFEKKIEKPLERKLSNIDVESDVNRAVFLDRPLWDTYHCPVDFCPFNINSMAQARENFASILGEMQRVIKEPVKWTTEEDEQILALSSDGADEELIADTVGRAIDDIRERSTYLGLLSEVLE